MSDVQQGPDWWLASDGKWYPPQSRPAPPPPPLPPRPATGFAAPSVPPAPSSVAVGAGLTGWLQALMWLVAGIAGLAVIFYTAAVGFFDEYMAAPVDSFSEQRALREWLDMDDAATVVSGFLVLIWVAMVIVQMVWLNRAHKTTQRLWNGERQWSSGWTIGGWFIPAAQFVIPKLVVNEIERIAFADRSSGRVEAGWRNRPTLGIGWVWWLTVAAGLLLNAVSTSIDLEYGTADEVRAHYWTGAAAMVAVAIGSAFGAVYFRRLGRALSPSAMAPSVGGGFVA